jgi:hypothetical protein
MSLLYMFSKRNPPYTKRIIYIGVQFTVTDTSLLLTQFTDRTHFLLYLYYRTTKVEFNEVNLPHPVAQQPNSSLGHLVLSLLDSTQ